MNEQAITIFCICDEIVKSYGLYEMDSFPYYALSALIYLFGIYLGRHARLKPRILAQAFLIAAPSAP